MVQGKYEFIYLILNIYSFKFEEHTKIWFKLLAVIQLDGTQGKEPLHMGWPLDKFSILSFTTFSTKFKWSCISQGGKAVCV